MATYGHTFTSGDTLTPTKLNDARTVTNIVNADISASAAIALSKLAPGALPSAITVASANIVNGTIVNADINASAAIAATKLASDSITNTQIKSDAAIAGTKIAPNFGSQNVVTTGLEVIGGAAQPSGDFVYSSGVSASGARSTSVTGHSTNNASTAVVRYSTNTSSQAFGANIILAKSNTQTAGDHVAVVDGQTLAFVNGFGSDGTNFVNAASIGFSVDGAVSAGSVPGSISFSTRAAGSTASAATRMLITNTGNVGIGTTSPSVKLDVAGIVNTNATYRVNGTIVVGPRRLDWETPSGSVDRTTYAVSTVTVAQLAARVNALIRDLEAHGLIGP
jgi:hypothetical protein